jgi:hypothetical protein
MTIQEAKEIQTNPNHPKHRLYRDGDPQIVAQVDQAYRAFYGEQQVDASTKDKT